MNKRRAIVNRALGIALIPLGGKKYPGRFAIVDAWAAPFIELFNWAPRANGSGAALYAAATIDGVHVKMHQIFCPIRQGYVPDHINGNTLDNRSENLRSITHRQNSWNTSGSRSGTSRYKGVYRDHCRGKWRARIMINGKVFSLGAFIDERDAAQAYDRAALQHHGTYARFNFPECVRRVPIIRYTYHLSLPAPDPILSLPYWATRPKSACLVRVNWKAKTREML